jgi:D-alanyl-D-alanine carboxypeptidase
MPKSPAPPPAVAPPDIERSDGLNRLVTATAEGRVVPGVRHCLLRIEDPTWPAGWSTAAATHHRNAVRPDPDTAFRIASVTKMITATTVLALTDQGRCRLDDPAAAHLPADVVDRLPLDGRAGPGTVTIRQLLDHTSGLPDFFSHPAIWAAIRHGGGRRRFTPHDLLDLAADAAPSFPPGTGRAYTDTGFVLAGLLVEHLTRAPLHEAYRTLVLDPAGMDATWLESSADVPRRRRMLAHDLDGRDITDMDPTVDWAGGGLVSTAADLARFLRALTGGRLLSREAWRAMTRWRPGPAGYYDDYGLGLGRYRTAAGPLVGHHGVWGAFAFWAPGLDAIITGTVSRARVDRRPLLEAIAATLLSA